MNYMKWDVTTSLSIHLLSAATNPINWRHKKTDLLLRNNKINSRTNGQLFITHNDEYITSSLPTEQPAVAMSLANGMVGTGYASRYRLQHRAGS